jgi:IS30 family transposase
MSGLPTTLIRSITWDQGIEMARHTDITADIGVMVSLLRLPAHLGSNENANGLLRQYFPKGTSLNTYTPDYPRAVEYEIKNVPRGRSPSRISCTYRGLADAAWRPIQPL